MRGKSAALMAGLCVGVAMSAPVDTLKAKNMFQLVKDNASGLTYQLHSIGAVQNGIIYGTAYNLSNISGGAPTDGVLIWDANYLDPTNGSVQIPGFYGFKGEISRPGSNFEGVFPMKLKGDTLIYTDSTDLIATLVTDPAKPVQLWKKTFPAEIKRINWTNTDTVYVTDTRAWYPHKSFHVVKENGGNPPTVVDSMMYLDRGGNFSVFSGNRYMTFTTETVYSWNLPLKEKDFDGKWSLPVTPISVATQGNYSYCATTVKTYVYDHTNMSSFELKDSLQGGGVLC